MEKWRENLRFLLNMHGVYPLSDWKFQLKGWAKEWVKEVKENGQHATLNLNDNIAEVHVHFKDLGRTRFSCKIDYKKDDSGQPFLSISHTIDFNSDKYFRSSESKMDEFYIWEHDEIYDLEFILKKGFVLEALNIALSKHMRNTTLEQ